MFAGDDLSSRYTMCTLSAGFDPASTRLHRTFQSISHTTWFILHGIDIHTIQIPAKSGVWFDSSHCVQSYIRSYVYCLNIKARTE